MRTVLSKSKFHEMEHNIAERSSVGLGNAAGQGSSIWLENLGYHGSCQGLKTGGIVGPCLKTEVSWVLV